MTACRPPATRNSPCMRCSTACVHQARATSSNWRKPTAARRWCRKRCGRPPPPSAGSERLAEPEFKAAAGQALASLSMIEAANAEEEALAIAVAMREALETPNKTVALVTPDRALARRVGGGARALASGGRRFRRRRAGRHQRRRVRAACGQGALGGLAAGAAAGAAQASAAASCGAGRRAMPAPSPHWSARCCAGRARAPGSDGLDHALAAFRLDREDCTTAIRAG